MTEGLTATSSLYSCGLMSKSCISDNAYVSNVKLAFEERSLIKELKFKRKWWFGLLGEYGLVLMNWAGARIRFARETEPRAVAGVGLERGCKRNSVLLFVWAVAWDLGLRLSRCVG